jgi:hypothetical protein
MIRKFIKNVAPNILYTPVTDAEASEFEERWEEDQQVVSCTDQNFRLYFQGRPAHVWNSTALRMLSRRFAAIHEIENELVSIERGMMARFKSLRKAYQMLRLSEARQKLAKQVARRQMRKSYVRGQFPLNILILMPPLLQLFITRLEACSLHPGLRTHENMIRQLGVGGMSSDESDYGELGTNPPARLRAPRYYVMNPLWRHPVLGQWLEVFDSIYLIRRRLGNELRGQYPRIRQHPATSVRLSINRRFVSHLPISAYKPEWISSRNDIEFVVCPSQEPYSFQHPEDIFG